ncbi:hypothetical protein WA026_002663 [Henosepilachna vigintioctopunctata]|uniref:Uncharacterized protein n=1 Tax=Henosepilachna vigintioctopunctata TaxID=420089 RepID=A0AAW1U1C7_9CUCU
MTECSYEYECSRAELLGIEKPNYEEYQRRIAENTKIDQNDLDTENLAEAECQNENLSAVGGKLGELNEILRGTQKKINRFRSSYGSLTNILKIKLSRNSQSGSDQSETSQTNNATEDETGAQSATKDKDVQQVNRSIIGSDKDIESNNANPNIENSNGTPMKKGDLCKALDNQVDRLDNLTASAERAELSMREQRNQMKKYLNFSFFHIGGGN